MHRGFQVECYVSCVFFYSSHFNAVQAHVDFLMNDPDNAVAAMAADVDQLNKFFSSTFSFENCAFIFYFASDIVDFESSRVRAKNFMKCKFIGTFYTKIL